MIIFRSGFDWPVVVESGNRPTVNNPIVGWNTQIEFGSIAADYEDADYPVANLVNAETHLLWKSTSTNDQYLTVASASGDIVDYFAVARHNFGTGLVAVSFEIDIGYGYEEVSAPYTPEDDDPLMFMLPASSPVAFRVKLAPDSVIPQAAVLYVGHSLVLPHRIYRDFNPLRLAVTSEVENGRSEQGEFLGRVAITERRSARLSLQNLPPRYYRTDIDPFVERSRLYPFFFAWRPGTYPEDVALCWTNSSPIPTNQRSNGMMRVDMDITGTL